MNFKKGRMISYGDYSIRVANDKEIMKDLVNLSGLTDNEYYCEIGTCTGKSLTAVYEHNPSIKLISIDPQPKPFVVKFYKDKKNVRLMKLKSSDAGKKLAKEGKKLSCVYIDGDHTYKWAAHDIKRFWPLWDGKGFFGGHDYVRRPEKRWGVREAVREHFGIENDCRINRRFNVLDGVLHMADVFWFYIRNDQMDKFKSYLRKL